MKILEIGKIITLEDDDELIVYSSIEYNEDNFVLLINSEKKEFELAIARFENNEIIIDILEKESFLNNPNLNEISNLFMEEMNKNIDYWLGGIINEE